MGKDGFLKFSPSLKIMPVLLLLLSAAVQPLHAADLPLVTSSPLSGVTFDDRPLSLPVQRNFQMAMLTASSELGRSCGKMEAYGWRMSQSEQGRVNQIFNTTVDHLRGMGYSVEAQAPTSVSRDITLFTADRADRHFITMWSAGELGLVMVMCEASQPYHYHNATASTPSVQVFAPPQDVIQSTLAAPSREKMRHSDTNFTPVGDWVGGYTCDQGYTGATLQITHLNGENFDGVFRFYPTPKNPYVPAGRYSVYGQYDKISQRILINPGKWMERPKNYYNTIIVGSFDPIARTFSAYFQGINGCTSLEAKAASEDYARPVHTVKKHVKKKKKIAKKKTAPVAVDLPVPVTPADVKGLTAPAPVAAPATAVTPAVPEPAATPDAAPSSIVLPAPVAAPAPVAPKAVAPVPATAAPVSITPPAMPVPDAIPTPPPAPATTPVPPLDATPKPSSGSIEPLNGKKYIQLAAASGQWFTPTVPSAPTATYVTPRAPSVPTAPTVQSAPAAPTVSTFNPTVAQVPVAPIAPQAVNYNTTAEQLPPATLAPVTAPTLPEATRLTPTVPQLPSAEMVPDTGGPRP